MTVRFQVSDDLLLDYASGALEEAWSLAVAAHLALCPASRARLAAFDAIGGAQMDALEPVAVNDDALDACLARLDDDIAAAPATYAAPDAVLPTPVQAYAGGDVDSIQWKRVGGGVSQAILPTEGPATARLLPIPPGVAVPEHGHNGLEVTVVLAGSFADGDMVFARGDVQEADGDVEHTPMVGGTEDCICLVVTDASLKFKALMPKIAQRFAKL